MPLPKCVVLDYLDPGPLSWRHMGTRITYRGRVIRIPDKHVRWVDACYVSDCIGSVDFSGRLWRDTRIDAYAETKKWIKGKYAYALGKYPAAFAIIRNDGTIELIGVHPAAAGLGLAERLIRHVGGTITAGTYTDNVPARKLYERLGMKEIKREEVFHEN